MDYYFPLLHRSLIPLSFTIASPHACCNADSRLARLESLCNGRYRRSKFPHQEIAEDALDGNTVAILARARHFLGIEFEEPRREPLDGSEVDSVDLK